jgi:hypothetical protein
MSKYMAEVQLGETYGIKVSDGVYVMEDKKMYTDEDAAEMGGIVSVSDGPEIEIPGSIIEMASDYVNMRARQKSSDSEQA